MSHDKTPDEVYEQREKNDAYRDEELAKHIEIIDENLNELFQRAYKRHHNSDQKAALAASAHLGLLREELGIDRPRQTVASAQQAPDTYLRDGEEP